MIRLLPAHLTPWRCRSCGNRHARGYYACPYTNLPRGTR
jgi:ribosomal protein L37AE/L43A